MRITTKTAYIVEMTSDEKKKLEDAAIVLAELHAKGGVDFWDYFCNAINDKEPAIYINNFDKACDFLFNLTYFLTEVVD